MKRARLAVLCLALLLVSATSGFAGVIWTAPQDDTLYGNVGGNLPSVWCAVTPNLLEVQGCCPLVLDTKIKVFGEWNKDVSSLEIFLVKGASADGTLVGHWDIFNCPGQCNIYDLKTNVDLDCDGVYKFKAFAVGYSCDATWKMECATLSTGECPPPCCIPIPAAFGLLGSGLLGLFGVNKARRIGNETAA